MVIMDKNYKFERNEGISLEQSPLSIILKYSDIDHRITNHYHFRIPLSPLPLTLETVNEKVDFFPGVSEMLTHKILWEDVPEQVISDALN